MKKSWMIAGIIALVVLGGAIIWLIINNTVSTTPPTNSSSQQTTTPPSTSSTSTDMTASSSVAVTIQDMAFQPQAITIKKGTKVTWTNQDTIKHSVVADSASNAANLPTTNTLFGKGQTYSFTFDTVGTISYHCSAHPTMTGTIEVVE